MREVHTAKYGTSRMQGSKRRKKLHLLKATSTTWPRERRFESADYCFSSGAPGAEVLQKKHSSKLVPNDEDLSWEDFLEAVPRVIISVRQRPGRRTESERSPWSGLPPTTTPIVTSPSKLCVRTKHSRGKSGTLQLELRTTAR